MSSNRWSLAPRTPNWLPPWPARRLRRPTPRPWQPGVQNAQAQDAAGKSSTDAQDAASSAAEAAASAAAADALVVDAGNAARDTAGDVATCQAYADVTYAWAEHMPDPIPPNILAVMGITGDHWSSRWWANYAQQYVENGLGVPGPVGPQGPVGPAGPQGPAGTGSISGLTAGRIPIAASATGLASSANLTGDVTSAPTTLVTTLATVNANVGTFQGLTVNGKGLVTAAANVGYLTGNQTITLSGDAGGSGSTAITVTLPNVNANTGVFQGLTLNAKGQVTAASNMGYAPLASPNFTGNITGTGNLTLTGSLTVGGNANPALTSGGGYTTVYAPDGTGGAASFMLGATGNPANYHRNTYHIFQDRAGATGFAQVNANGFYLGANANPALALFAGGGYTQLAAPDVAAGSNSGSIFVGTAANTNTLHWNTGHVFSNRAGSVNFAQFTSGGTYNVSGSWLTFSDSRLKRKIEDFTPGLAEIVRLRPVSFEYNGKANLPTDRRFVGLVADEVEAVLPQMVSRERLRRGMSVADEDDFMTLDTVPMIYALVNAVKELRQQVQELTARVEASA